MIDDFPSHLQKLSKLEKKKLKDLCFTDEFWELETSFKSCEKWALDPWVRKAINAMYHHERALEEIVFLEGETKRYYTWLVSMVNRCESLLAIVEFR